MNKIKQYWLLLSYFHQMLVYQFLHFFLVKEGTYKRRKLLTILITYYTRPKLVNYDVCNVSIFKSGNMYIYYIGHNFNPILC